MAIKSKKYSAIYTDLAKIELENDSAYDTDLPDIPFGSEITITIHYDKPEYPGGPDTIVWATHNPEQAETIKGALRAQNIESVIIESKLKAGVIFLLKVEQSLHIERASNFIWKSKEGLQLKPDWFYPLNQRNESFEKWTG
ncbi:MAG: hypothetical protein GF313_17545 [Caldithrix sp.]|nr:hypothetical protein [Caldithrix sp.]